MPRRPLLRIHRWLALTIGLLLALQAVTGLVLAVSHEADLSHRRAARPPFSLDDAAARAAEAGGTLDRMKMMSDGVVEARLSRPGEQPVFALLDARTGAVTAVRPLWRDPVRLALYWHATLLWPAGGKSVLFLLGLTAVAVASLGAALWWPRRRAIGRGFKINSRLRGEPLQFDLHRVAGAYVAVPIILTAALGAIITLQPKVFPAMPADGCEPPAAPGPGPARSLDSLVGESLAGRPGMQLEMVRFCGPGNPVAAVMLTAHHGDRGERVQFWFDRSRPDAAPRMFDSRRAADGMGAGALLLPLHTGRLLGLPGRLINMAAGVGILALGVTGATLWLLRRARRRAPPKEHIDR